MIRRSTISIPSRSRSDSALAGTAHRLAANCFRQLFERSGLLGGGTLFGILDAEQPAQLDLTDRRRQDRANAAVEPCVGQVDAAQPAVKPDKGPLGQRSRFARRLGDPPTDVDVDRHVFLVAREHLAAGRIEELHAAIEPPREVDGPGEFEVGTAIDVAVIDLHDVAEAFDDHRFRLVDEDHARRNQDQSARRRARRSRTGAARLRRSAAERDRSGLRALTRFMISRAFAFSLHRCCSGSSARSGVARSAGD